MKKVLKTETMSLGGKIDLSFVADFYDGGVVIVGIASTGLGSGFRVKERDWKQFSDTMKKAGFRLETPP